MFYVQFQYSPTPNGSQAGEQVDDALLEQHLDARAAQAAGAAQQQEAGAEQGVAHDADGVHDYSGHQEQVKCFIRDAPDAECARGRAHNASASHIHRMPAAHSSSLLN